MTQKNSFENGYSPKPEENVFTSLFNQYEKVIVQSLITSFGLDLFIRDQIGGDVDTIVNRPFPSITTVEYTTNSRYTTQCESYYHEFHGAQWEEKRILAGLQVNDLLGTENSNMFLDYQSMQGSEVHEVTSYQKYETVLEHEQTVTIKTGESSSMPYNGLILYTYYTSPAFMNDVRKAAVKTGFKMGLREAFGLVFTEIWFAVKYEMENMEGEFDFKKFLEAIGHGISKGAKTAKEKYKEIFEKFVDGFSAGAFASLTTTLCNMFFTTSKSTVRIIRQAYASVVQALKILFINPNHYPYGERLKATVKILSTGASVILGTLVSESLAATPIGAIPVVGEIIQTFCGTLVAGILSCTLLYYIDQSKTINQLVQYLNIKGMTSEEKFEAYAAGLMQIDVKQFQKEVEMYSHISNELSVAETEEEVHAILFHAYSTLKIKLPWQGNFDAFMQNKSSFLVFE